MYVYIYIYICVSVFVDSPGSYKSGGVVPHIYYKPLFISDKPLLVVL